MDEEFWATREWCGIGCAYAAEAMPIGGARTRRADAVDVFGVQTCSLMAQDCAHTHTGDEVRKKLIVDTEVGDRGRSVVAEGRSRKELLKCSMGGVGFAVLLKRSGLALLREETARARRAEGEGEERNKTLAMQRQAQFLFRRLWSPSWVGTGRQPRVPYARQRCKAG